MKKYFVLEYKNYIKITTCIKRELCEEDESTFLLYLSSKILKLKKKSEKLDGAFQIFVWMLKVLTLRNLLQFPQVFV